MCGKFTFIISIYSHMYIYVEFASLVDCWALIIKSGKKVDGFLPDKIVIKWVSVEYVGNLVLKH